MGLIIWVCFIVITKVNFTKTLQNGVMTQICNFLICIKKKDVCTTNKPNCSKTETPNRHLLIDAIYLVDLVKDSALGNQMMQRYVTNTRNMYKKCNIYPSFRISERCERSKYDYVVVYQKCDECLPASACAELRVGTRQSSGCQTINCECSCSL